MDDFSVLDGEVGKRLNDMVPVPVSTSLYAMIHLLISAFSLSCSFCCHSMFLRQMERSLLLMNPSQIIKDSLTGKPQFCSIFFSLFANHVCGFNCLPHKRPISYKWPILHYYLDNLPFDSIVFFPLFCYRLVLYGLVELKVKGDGNCQVRVQKPSFSPLLYDWHLTVLNYWFILYGLLNSFEHCQINFTALLNITDLFGSKWWSRLVLWKGLVAFQPHLNFSMHMDFMGKSLHSHLLTVVLHYV